MGDYEPSWMKFRYGAWYLKPKTWRKMKADDPLKDPKELQDDQMSEAKKKSNHMVSDLSLYTHVHFVFLLARL